MKTSESGPIDAVRRWKLRFYKERARFRLRARALDMPVAQNVVVGLRSVMNPTRTLLTYPDMPEEGHVLEKLCALLGFVCTNNVESRFDFTWHFEDTSNSGGRLPVGVDHAQTINARCLNIGKRYIAQVFEDIFGYSLTIDPTIYTGPAVLKSDRNAAHDGRTIQCPIVHPEVRPDCVYQRLIDNQNGDGTVTDLRMVVHRGRMPLAYRKYRPIETRYSNTNTRVELCQPEDVLSQPESARLLRFADTIGMDFGEVDVLRDRHSGKLYVVDANNTPMGPPNGLSEGDSARALRLMLESFRELLAAQRVFHSST